MLQKIHTLTDRSTRWLLAHLPQPLDIAATLTRFGASIQGLLPRTGTLAERVEALGALDAAFAIIRVAETSAKPVEQVMRMYHAVGEKLHLQWVAQATHHIPQTDHWARLAVAALQSDFQEEQQRLTLSALRIGTLEAWAAPQAEAISRSQQLMEEVQASAHPSAAMLVVALRKLRAIV
jgi:NAD-specific glutamate dehydrogenase